MSDRRRKTATRRAAEFVDERVGGARFVREALGKVFPDHFSFMFGEVALYSFVVLVVTGVFLTFFFVPSSRTVTYEGSYRPMHGQHVSAAYDSALRLSWDVRAGLVMRQIHHWAALVFLAAIVLHLARIFFTGAFRRPREINWIVGVTLLVLAIGNGFAGYSLLDDLLSGTGLRIMFSVVESVPVVGDTVAFWVFGGEYPSDQVIGRLFIAHVLLVPAMITALLGIHLALVTRQKHTQFAGPGRTEDNVVGTRLWPTYAAKSISLFLAVAGSLALLGGLFQINPIWLYGPYDPAEVTTAAQPDWYMGWLEGALRLMPPWEVRGWGHTVPNVFFPAVLLPGLTFAALYAWPFLERRFTHDHAEHHLLDRPRDRPVRSALGAAALTFYLVLFVAGSQDVIAAKWNISVNHLNWVLRGAAIVLPVVAGFAVHRWCRDLGRGDRQAAEALDRLAEAEPHPPVPHEVDTGGP
ncbi:cytochrome b [Aquihabitans sp. McL0605]|uniref:cytochrome bc1 complex cytochrome b subunit n=1 Tax=Aquihabitans sp. McL0605 TaxID=3415671 RepID=UPI003CEC5F30